MRSICTNNFFTQAQSVKGDFESGIFGCFVYLTCRIRNQQSSNLFCDNTWYIIKVLKPLVVLWNVYPRFRRLKLPISNTILVVVNEVPTSHSKQKYWNLTSFLELKTYMSFHCYDLNNPACLSQKRPLCLTQGGLISHYVHQVLCHQYLIDFVF